MFDGGPDILILNHLTPIVYDLWNENSDLKKLPQYYAVNTISYINIATLLLPELHKTNGSIVVVSSFAGVMSQHQGLRHTVAISMLYMDFLTL